MRVGPDVVLLNYIYFRGTDYNVHFFILLELKFYLLCILISIKRDNLNIINDFFFKINFIKLNIFIVKHVLSKNILSDSWTM